LRAQVPFVGAQWQRDESLGQRLAFEQARDMQVPDLSILVAPVPVVAF